MFNEDGGAHKMTVQYEFRPTIIVKGDNRTKARNKLLEVLSKAELANRISRFDVDGGKQI